MDVLSAGTKKVAVVEREPLGSTVLFSLWLLRNRVTRHGSKKRGRRGWGNVSQQWKITQIVLTQLGLIQDFWLGGGGVQTLVQKGLLNFFVANYFSPHPLPPATVHVRNPWPLTCTWILLVKGCTLGTFSSCAIIVDQLKKQRRPRVRVSQSVNAGRQWRGKYCFASRGEQIIGGYQKTITFLNILGN